MPGYTYDCINEKEQDVDYYEKVAIGLDVPASAMCYNDQRSESICYQGVALLKLNKIDDSKGRFNKLLDYGEKHVFSCYDEKHWEEEIVKMKLGGINVIASYIFGNHHEEIEGIFDWNGNKNLRLFTELCGKYNMYVIMYIKKKFWKD